MKSQPRIVVLGVTGMLGHKMFQRLSESFSYVYGICRDSVTSPRFRNVELLRSSQIVQGVDAQDWSGLQDRLRQIAPDYIVNCMGIIKQRDEARSAIPSLLINSLLPHRLAESAAQWGGFVIHFSTDCVFSGRKGNYREDDLSDAEDLYGRTKFLGEVAASNAITLRTSIIGRELAEFRGLLEWFLAQRGKVVQGYQNAIYSGVTTNYLAGLVADLIESRWGLNGVYQVASSPISKYQLLDLIRQVFELKVEIRPVEGENCDRSMCADRFFAATGQQCPSWPEMIYEMRKDTTPYDAWRTESYESTFKTL